MIKHGSRVRVGYGIDHEKNISFQIKKDMEPLSDRKETLKIPIPEILSLAVPYLMKGLHYCILDH